VGKRAAANVFVRSGTLLARNVKIIVPGLAIGFVAAVLQYGLEPSPYADFSSDYGWRLLQGAVVLISSILSIAFTTGMADAAWRAGRAAFADGLRAFHREAGHVLMAMLALFAIGFAATALVPFTVGLSLVVYVFFCVYTMAAAVVGERPGIVAVGESARIAFGRPLPTLGVVLAIVVTAFVSSAVASELGDMPFVGPFVAAVAQQIAIAYATLVIVGEYRLLRGL